MVSYCLSRVARLAGYAAVIALLAASFACADYAVVFSDNFDDGNWTTNPLWSDSPADPSVSVSTERSTSAPYSLKIAASNNTGAIKTSSGIIAAAEPYVCTFNLYVESIAEEGIPLCLRDFSNTIIAIIFLLPNGKVQLSEYSPTGRRTAQLPYPLTYGQWHSFRLVHDGAKYDLYLDGHTSPDATLARTTTGAPTQLLIGNFGTAHTGTFYIDDLVISADPPPPPGTPGKLYVHFGSDTSTGGLGTNNHYNVFPVDDYSYVSPDGQAAQVMAESWRDAHRDSLGNTIKLTWYMNCGSIYSGGITTGPIFPYELMMDNHGSAIAQWGDEMAYHYHTWFWDGTAWTQTEEFTPCLPDFEMTVAHFILDRSFYPASFRAGWNWMSNLWQNYLDEWIPYRFEGRYPLGKWVPYHPSYNDWRVVGNQRGWECWYEYIPSQTAAKIEAAFAAAYNGQDQVMCLWSHLKEVDFATKIDEAHAHFVAVSARYPGVEYQYVTAREAMRKWRNGTDFTPPVVSVSTSDLNGVRTAIVSSNEPIYQLQPFIAQKKLNGTYTRLDCTPIDATHWRFSYDLADTVQISAAVTDWFGNATVKPLPAAFLLSDIHVISTNTTIQVSWRTNQPGNTQTTYQLMPSGTTMSNTDTHMLTEHQASFAGLDPGRVHKIDIASTNSQGERVAAKSIYVLTNSANPAIIDNSDPGFSVTGAWSTGTTAGGRYGTDYRYATTSPTGTLHADWTWQTPKAGFYRVSVWWSQGSNRCSEATYSVIIGPNAYAKVVNQQVLGGQWNEHGVYYAAAGQSITVRLHNQSTAGNLVIADAARFEPAYTALSDITLGRLIPNGARVELPTSTVTAVFDGEYYIQEKSGVPGIKVIGGGVVEGGQINVSGVLSTVNGERVITNPMVQ